MLGWTALASDERSRQLRSAEQRPRAASIIARPGSKNCVSRNEAGRFGQKKNAEEAEVVEGYEMWIGSRGISPPIAVHPHLALDGSLHLSSLTLC
jgi:hypothetical protein